MLRSEFHFLCWLGTLVLAGLLLICAWNWWMDPYDIYHDFRIAGINHFTPIAGGNKERVSKPGQIRRDKPDVLVLGSSRVNWAIDPEHPFLREKGDVVLNAALGGCTMIEAWRLTLHAAAMKKPTTILLGLDAEMFCLARERSPDWDQELAVRGDGTRRRGPGWSRFGNTLFSLDAWNDSRETFKQSRRRKTQSREELLQRGGAYQLSLITPDKRLSEFNNRLKEAQFNFTVLRNGNDIMTSNLDAFQAFIDWAEAENVEVFLYISPYHQAVLDTMVANRSWVAFEQWKRALVVRNNSEFPLWDFSGYHAIARDPGPDSNHPFREMKWWVECSHFRKIVGDLILDRIAGGSEQPGDFGLCLTANNLEATFQLQRGENRP